MPRDTGLPIIPFLAQEDAPPPGPAISPGTPGEPGTVQPGGPTPPDEGLGQPARPPATLFETLALPLMLGFVILLIFFTGSSQRKEKKRRQAMMSALKKGDRVQTVGGMVGSVVELRPHHVILKVDENNNIRITFTRAAVQSVLKEDGESSDD